MGRFRRRASTVQTGYPRLGQWACDVCDSDALGSSVYVMLIGLLGTAITAFDLIRTMNCKQSTSADPIANSSSAQDATAARKVPTQGVERDLKLMTSILGIEHYTLIMLGVITDYPILHAPWLLMQMCVMGVELSVFFVRLVLEGLHVSRDEILMSLLTIHNWLQVFCVFQRQIEKRVA